MLDILGVVGIGISVGAYVPQVVHLWREHCSAGISTRAWAMWLVSGLLIGLVALQRGDLVFISLQASTLSSAAVILLLAQRYRGMYCETHQPHTVPSTDVPRAASSPPLARPNQATH